MVSSKEDKLVVVGIGASAGGLEALEKLFSNIEYNSNVAYVVVQHLSPDYKSMMAEILSKHTKIPIQQAINEKIVNPGNIYLIPPKKNIFLQKGKLILEDIPHNSGLNLPIDNFLISLAEEMAENSIAIILSGTGSDGTRGIRKIKEKGGLVIVQDDREAKFDGMPKSAIATGLVDYILPVEKIGPTIQNYINKKHKLEPIEFIQETTNDFYENVLSIIKKQSGIDFSYYKPTTISRRIARRMSLNQIDKLEDYVLFLEENPREVEILHRELLIGVTNFFRDPEAFEILKEKAFPLIFSKKQKKDQVRFWVAGCSTGEEAYSISIIVKEYMRKENLKLDVKIFATDADPTALKTAGSGLYPESISADISEDRLKTFFIKKGNLYQVHPEIRELVIFAPQNLLKDPPFSRIDLICCRNLLIYLQPEAQKKILQMFHYSLIPGGILFIGPSESLGDLSNAFQEIHSKWKIYQSNTEKVSFPLAGNLASDNISFSYRKIYSDTIKRKTKQEESILDKLFSKVLEKYLPPCAVVNQNFQILQVVGNINPYVKLQSGKVDFDILNMVDKSIRIALSTGLRKCFYENKEVVYKNIILNEDLNKKFINLIIQPINLEDEDTKLAFVIFEESKNYSENQISSDEKIKFHYDEYAHRRILELEQELDYTKQNLQATIEQLETSNEELQATNEELLAANEELQSTNEELQSVNEELITLNSEHQNKIRELTELNNDMNNLLENTEVGVIFLDENLNIRKFTPNVREVIHLLPTDKGRPLSHISHKFRESIDLHNEAQKVLTNSEKIEKELSSILKNGQVIYYLTRILPYKISENKNSGVIISLVDITEYKKLELTALEQLRTKNKILNYIQEAIITTNSEFKILSWNALAEKLFGYKEEEAIGKDYFSLLHPNYTTNEIQELKTFLRSKNHIERITDFIDKQGRKLIILSMKDIVSSPDDNETRIVIICRQYSDPIIATNMEKKG